MDNKLKVDVSFKDEAPAEVFSILNEVGAEGVQDLKQRALTGVETVVIAILVAQALAKLVTKLASVWKCGVIVDARGSRVHTEKNCDLPRGSVLVIRADGTEVTLHEPSEIEIDSALKDLVSGS